MSAKEDDFGAVLSTPICIGDLVNTGAQFEINTNFYDDLPDELFDDLHIGDDDEEEDMAEILSPWEKPFEELRKQMVKISDDIYKKVTHPGNAKEGKVPDRARVKIHYNAFWEGETAPFDSTYMRGQSLTFHCDQMAVLDGLELAVKTMLMGEESQFVISYRVLYREMGCPPRIKRKADGLFIIKLLHFVDVGDENAVDSLPKEERNKFSAVYEEVKKVHLNGLDSFKTGNIHRACKSFHRAVNALELCRLSNDEEEELQRMFLVKLYINLAVCYNRLNLPQKACSMCDEIRRITDINKNCKALFQEGRALLKIGDYRKAKGSLIKAQQLEPNNEEINKELKLLDDKYDSYRRNERELCRKAMGLIRNSEIEKEKDDRLDTFKGEIKKMLEDFKNDVNVKQLTLPDGLSHREITCVKELSKDLDLTFKTNEAHDIQKFVLFKDK